MNKIHHSQEVKDLIKKQKLAYHDMQRNNASDPSIEKYQLTVEQLVEMLGEDAPCRVVDIETYECFKNSYHEMKGSFPDPETSFKDAKAMMDSPFIDIEESNEQAAINQTGPETKMEEDKTISSAMLQAFANAKREARPAES